ncbi:sensor domain-containing diguanylate cyclase [Phreatobacter cathodiphilus]|uniref:GGDEF domain-containing protein n=1 Tax=Phreatobacter cathodiphilus TaxID=1868589 RepID=A0A2S0NDA2_9HYPH|nr:sensor domain-containing diguanylate cyclase [Phreatobacter cathodiphilus]AVO45911.1 GGDEF domain-containing protein [Phreatobacter cathodiphilus]
MQTDDVVFSAPTWRLTRWLAAVPEGTPDTIRQRLVAELFGNLPVFFGGLIATVVGPLSVVVFKPSVWFIAWLMVEAVICAVRLGVLVHGRRAARRGERTYTDLHIVMALAWSANLGLGCLMAILSGDWLIATIACVPAAAMVGGICFRNFAAPRLASTMIALSLSPMPVATLMSGESALLGVTLLVPLFLFSMSVSAFQMNATVVSAMVAEQENRHRATHDDLTGLCNRAHLITQLGERLTRERPRGLALFYLDLDGFKQVNDTFGHGTGDRLLQLVSEQINATVRAGDVTARLGGDEFVVLADGLDRAGAIALGHNLCCEIARSYSVNGHDCVIGVSVGVALAPEQGGEATSLLAAADAALYTAKGRGAPSVVMAGTAVGPSPSIVPTAGPPLPATLQLNPS